MTYYCIILKKISELVEKIVFPRVWSCIFCTWKSAQRNSDSISSWKKWQNGLFCQTGERNNTNVLQADLWVEIILPTGFPQWTQKKKENASTHVRSVLTEGNAIQEIHMEVHHHLLLEAWQCRPLSRGMFWYLTHKFELLGLLHYSKYCYNICICESVKLQSFNCWISVYNTVWHDTWKAE